MSTGTMMPITRQGDRLASLLLYDMLLRACEYNLPIFILVLRVVSDVGLDRLRAYLGNIKIAVDDKELTIEVATM